MVASKIRMKVTPNNYKKAAIMFMILFFISDVKSNNKHIK